MYVHTLDFPCIVNASELGAETGSSQTRSPLLCHGTCHASSLYIRHILRPCQRLLMHIWLQATVDIHTPLCLPFFVHSDCGPPRLAFLAFPGRHRLLLDLNCRQRLPSTPLLKVPGADDDADGDGDCYLGPPRGTCEDA
jgi:hypothetical protein